ncbi:hypothetical protein GA0061070_10973 [Kosakonia oryziphila]|uniref:Uncharacterized protein n=1 Tax=Kosakonia oryziphila TaxID=1005667 RepID=A0A1C4GPL8_9ENTR|nr:hypothetical protein GA0061070_10973 [Kosakonia oryziphila]
MTETVLTESPVRALVMIVLQSAEMASSMYGLSSENASLERFKMKTDLVITLGGSVRKRLHAIWMLSGTLLALVFSREAKIVLEDCDILELAKKI